MEQGQGTPFTSRAYAEITKETLKCELHNHVRHLILSQKSELMRRTRRKSPPEEIFGCLIKAGKGRHVSSILKELKCTSQAGPEKHQVFKKSHTDSFSYLSPQRGGKSKDCFVLYASDCLFGSADQSTKPGAMRILLLVLELSGGSQRYQTHTGPRAGSGGVRQFTIQSGFFLLLVEFYLKVDEKRFLSNKAAACQGQQTQTPTSH